ncbi:MAG: Fumarylacetoacetate (FAA) hydrolase [Promethearchaeota archaeon]|nr:MAG: Fumarylacetoacetate (FAA) hydrolase [Candidatus Lokiarchaeota archaeon]
MKFATVKQKNQEIAALVVGDHFFPIPQINTTLSTDWYNTLGEILEHNQLDKLISWFNRTGREYLENTNDLGQPLSDINFSPLYRHPHKIWGIGLNYRDHAEDLLEKTPSLIPASFMKSDTTIIGPNDTIFIPTQSSKTTGEAELGVIIKKKCKNIPREDWLEVVAGFTTIIDMTAEDILRKNPRYLTLSKNFDTFFSFGPLLITPDEFADIMDLSIATVINGEVHAKNTLSNMTFPPDFLVSFHSEIMTLLPGDIISTGTPRAVQLRDGDIIECQIDGFMSLKNPVKDLKNFQ